MILGKFFGAIRAQLNKIANIFFESDPIAVAHLRHHVPLGFHGTFTERVASAENQ